MNRKLRKLKRDPKLFFKDMYDKYALKMKKHIPVKYTGSHHFTVVTAVYNVEKYLDEFFDSLVKQTLSFKKHIQIICVDDGSKDHSAEIIKKWQKKYPNNIRYIYKENGGQASARNLGLKSVETEWVTFIDPDDFLSPNYFQETDKNLSVHANTSMVVCNLKMFMENKKIVQDTHPLKYRFPKAVNAVAVKDLNNHLNLSAASSFFKTQIIKTNKLTFNHHIKPNFEDGKFIADYLLAAEHTQALFLKEAVYFYRKREDGTSTLDGSWQKPEKFKDVFIHGFLPMLEKYQPELGYIPNNIQKTALYDMYWYLSYLINRPEKIGFLSETQKVEFYQCYEKVFQYIDEKNIMEFNIAGAWFFHKVGMLGAFKQQRPPFQIAYIENIDRENKQVLISYFSYFDDNCSFEVNGKDTIPAYQKTVTNEFNGKLFAYEKRSWLPFFEGKDLLTIKLNGTPMRISVKGKTFTKGISFKELLDLFRPSEKYLSDGSWLLMDRETKADDNAEHFYRYMMRNHPEQACCFVLNKDSIDWPRLEKEGFNLVEFGSTDYEKHLRKANKIISSHLEKHINNYFGDNYEFSKKFIFLQHGITKDDLSQWFNTKKNFHGLVTVTIPEYHSVIEEGNKYKLGKKETFLTGFPRHDSLLSGNVENAKKILIVPTWRSYIMGAHIGNGANTRELNSRFLETDYAQHWYALLHSNKLEALAKQYGYEITFAPHPNIEPYLALFDVPPYIKIWGAATSNNSMQNLFQQSSMLITDYSSIAFEMAFLGKQTLYYQFDKEAFRSGIHTYQQGYFEYETDGFGPVVETLDELTDKLESILKNGGKIESDYAVRIKQTFKYRDTDNCKRVYEAIIRMDKLPTETDFSIVKTMLESALAAQDWKNATSRAQLLLSSKDAENKALAITALCTAALETSDIQAASDLLEQDGLSQTQRALLNSCLNYRNLQWQGVIDALQPLLSLNETHQVWLLQAYAKLGQTDKARQCADILLPTIDGNKAALAQAWVNAAAEDWYGVIRLLSKAVCKDKKDLQLYQPELLLSRAYRNTGNYEQAHQCLVNFEKHTRGFVPARIEIAHLAYTKQNYKKCIDQIDKCFDKDLSRFSTEILLEYAVSLAKTGQFEVLKQLMESTAGAEIFKFPELVSAYTEILAKNKNWYGILDYAQNLPESLLNAAMYPLMLAHYRLGNTEYVYKHHRMPTAKDAYEYWEIVAETALFEGDVKLAVHCYKQMIAIYPEYSKQANLIKLLDLIQNKVH
ncbi:CDP-glycerol glycerophosphotransferase family protein [Neisseria chenwenguii]|uniref:Glycosyl transferase n=1 Tax=Neisseria chenwenguii TaxID=1853278 RepID=A0A220S214_9NEIS|nr:CDP-glycerol glycerophosphotransferase family protein [Neisseria chenwenguii]ASK27540.1 glycosyl transferase [Neisseria chenwenguii]ROV55618.1 glycosyltransferase [Neisseria chenwenguii]